MAGAEFFQQFEQETEKTPEERLNRLINAVKNAGSDIEYFSWEMNYNLAQFNQAQVVIMATMILELRSVKKVYDYFFSKEYARSGVIALQAGHATDKSIVYIAEGFKDSRKILEDNNGVVTQELKEKIVSIISINLLFDALKLIYALFDLSELFDEPYVDVIHKDSFVTAGKEETDLAALQTYLEQDIFNFDIDPDNELGLDIVGKRLWDACLYSIGSAQTHFNIMTADRRERKGSPYSTSKYAQFVRQTNEDINRILEIEYFKS